MTQGCVIFAHNNGDIDYIKLAERSAENIKKYLNLPTTIITDADSKTTSTRWFADYDKSVKWLNSGRSRAYELSPYEQTVLLDADYVVNSDQLLRLFSSKQDFLAHRDASSVTGTGWSKTLDTFGEYRFPMWWATVVYFTKSNTARAVFDTMQMVETNYEYYANLYNFKKRPYRNDYALSIALNIADGHFNAAQFNFPWALQSIVPEHTLTCTDDVFRVEYDKKWLELKNMDFHAMGKRHLEALYD